MDGLPVASGPLLEQFVEIAGRAAGAGRPLDQLPELRLGPISTVWFDAGQRATVQLDPVTARAATADRAWTIAHELSHVLRVQERRRPTVPPAVISIGVIALLLAVVSATVPLLTAVLWPVALAVPSIAALWLCRLALQRNEETEADVVAATVFGEVLTPEGVRRVTLDEGRLSHLVPALMRSHERPGRRRARGLQATNVHRG